MSPFRSFPRLAGALAAGLTLAGCVSLFPRTQPVQLYRFGLNSAAAPPASPAPGAPVVGKGEMNFEDAAAGDRILTVMGRDVAYVSGVRWVSPAPILFDEALSRAFLAEGAPRLAEAEGAARAQVLLDLDVQTFETRYVHGPGAAPEVVVQLRAELVRAQDHSIIADQVFTSTKQAGENRMGSIVQAYDEAVQETLSGLVAWATHADG